jgi:hypothetical protein
MCAGPRIGDMACHRFNRSGFFLTFTGCAVSGRPGLAGVWCGLPIAKLTFPRVTGLRSG